MKELLQKGTVTDDDADKGENDTNNRKEDDSGKQQEGMRVLPS
jgi:hypothetical protein